MTWNSESNTRLSQNRAANPDFQRHARKGVPEVIITERKTAEQSISIARQFLERTGRAILSRVPEELEMRLRQEFEGDAEMEWLPGPRAVVLRRPGSAVPSTGGRVGVLTAGTSDIPWAEEAALLCREMGCDVHTTYDVGVAGIHRLWEPLRYLLDEVQVDVLIVAVMGLIREPGQITAGSVSFNGLDMLSLSPRNKRKYLGNDISMIFQEPMASLNPAFTVGRQISEVLQLHDKLSRRQSKERTVELLNEVGLPEPGKILHAWPHQLSGGMNQRVMIAMAIACRPKLLIADEPTTALDVTVKAQILGLLNRLQRDNGMAMIFITHDLAIVSTIADRVLVMYAGQLVESCTTQSLFQQPLPPGVQVYYPD